LTMSTEALFSDPATKILSRSNNARRDSLRGFANDDEQRLGGSRKLHAPLWEAEGMERRRPRYANRHLLVRTG
jgi:hypothetical protein